MTPRNIVLLGITAVLGYDTLASVAALTFGFPYSRTGIGSLAIYFGVGFIGARLHSRWFGLLAGALVGIADATLGWGISWVIGPGRVTSDVLPTRLLILTAISVVAFATICAGVGSVIGQFTRRIE